MSWTHYYKDTFAIACGLRQSRSTGESVSLSSDVVQASELYKVQEAAHCAGWKFNLNVFTFGLTQWLIPVNSPIEEMSFWLKHFSGLKYARILLISLPKKREKLCILIPRWTNLDDTMEWWQVKKIALMPHIFTKRWYTTSYLNSFFPDVQTILFTSPPPWSVLSIISFLTMSILTI